VNTPQDRLRRREDFLKRVHGECRLVAVSEKRTNHRGTEEHRVKARRELGIDLRYALERRAVSCDADRHGRCGHSISLHRVQRRLQGIWRSCHPQERQFRRVAGEMVCILGRSGVGKSVALHNIMGSLSGCRADHCRRTGHHRLQRGAARRNPQEGHHGVPERRALRFLERRRKCCLPLREKESFRKIRFFRSSMAARNGWRQGDARSVALRSFYRMKRSVAIARALSAQPSACSTTSPPPWWIHDGESARDLIARLKLQLHLTSVVVTHDMRLAKKLADRIVFLYEGRAIFFGPTRIWKNRPNHHSRVPGTG